MALTTLRRFLLESKEGFKAYVPQEVDVKAIRNRLGMTQAKFSDTFGFSLDAIKHWEGGRRTPGAPVRTLLTVIGKNPAAVLTALNPAAAVSPSKRTTAPASRHRKRRASRGATKRNAYSAVGKRVAK